MDGALDAAPRTQKPAAHHRHCVEAERLARRHRWNFWPCRYDQRRHRVRVPPNAGVVASDFSRSWHCSRTAACEWARRISKGSKQDKDKTCCWPLVGRNALAEGEAGGSSLGACVCAPCQGDVGKIQAGTWCAWRACCSWSRRSRPACLDSGSKKPPASIRSLPRPIARSEHASEHGYHRVVPSPTPVSLRRPDRRALDRLVGEIPSAGPRHLVGRLRSDASGVPSMAFSTIVSRSRGIRGSMVRGCAAPRS